MKRIIALLIILTFAFSAFEASAQQMVGKGQVRKYSVKQPPTSKFSWTIFKKDGVSLADRSKYKIFKEEPTNPMTTPGVSVAAPFQSTTGSVLNPENVIYVYWLGDEDQEFVVQAREYNVDTECSSSTYNLIKQNVKILRFIDMFRATLTWDDNRDFNNDGNIDKLDLFDKDIPEHVEKLDCNNITSIADVVDPISGIKEKKSFSTFSFSINVWNQRSTAGTKWQYKYKYLVLNDRVSEPANYEWDSVASSALKEVDGSIAKDMLVFNNIEIAKGDGFASVWVKLTLIKDGYGADALNNPETIFISKAIVKKVPKDQILRFVD